MQGVIRLHVYRNRPNVWHRGEGWEEATRKVPPKAVAEVSNGCKDDFSHCQVLKVFIILKWRKKTSQKESEIRYYCDSFQLTVYTQPYLVGIQEHLADQKPRCVTGGNPKRGVPIGWSPPRTRVQKLDGFYISIIWSGFCFLRGYRFPDTNSRCGSSQGCTRLDFLWRITDGRLIQQYCAAAAWRASSFSSANVQYRP